MKSQTEVPIRPKRNWSTPRLTIHGTVEQLTQQTKYKTFGPGDDVIVNDQSILANLGS